ncbi:MAG: hypothetical protein IPP94_16520 [Ignavibacteria bacterium]|nr:hypothetical protein [Ignavibacteria bacterium]
MRIHRILPLALLLLGALPAAAQQMIVTLNVTARPSPYLSDWASRRETALCSITTPAGSQGVAAKFYAEIRKDGVVQARTRTADMPVVNIPAGTSTYFAEQLISFPAVDFVGDAKNTAARTGQLPAGTYEFCLDLRTPDDRASLLTAVVCRSFYLTTYQAPSLLQPEEGATVQSQSYPMFRWTPVTPAPPLPARYRVMVFEVLEGQSPSIAFRVNKPILDREIAGITQLLWPADFQLPGRVDRYIWTVRALDEKGNPLGENDGYAPPFTFTMGAQARRGGEAGGAEKIAVKGGEQVAQKTGQQGGEQTAKKQGGKQDAGPVVIGGLQMAQGPVKTKSGGPPPIDTTNFGQGNPQTPASGCQPGNVVPTPVGSTPGTKAAAAFIGDSIKVGFFEMKVLTATGSAASLAGTGSIVIPWLRTPIAVKFTALKVNPNDEAYDGDVVSELEAVPDPYQTQWATNMVGGLPWTTKRIKNLDTWLKANFPKLVKNLNLQQQVDSAIDDPVKLPLGLNDIKGITIAIAEMKFTASGAQAAAVMSLPVLEHDSSLGFKASSIFFTPSGPSFTSGNFALLSDVVFANNANTYSVTFKAPAAPGTGTFVDWDCDGFRQLQVDIDVALPRTWVVPSPDDSKQVISNIKTWVSDWDDWIVTAKLNKCTIVGTNGTDLEVLSMAWDHSDVRNPAGIVFPKGYLGDSSLAFQGFFIKQAKLMLPEKLSSYDDPAQRITAYINNLIVNKSGVTCDIEARNVLNFPKANIAALGASIDTVKLSLVNSSVTTAYLRGAITIPIADSAKANTLDYKALFQNGNGFQFSLTPKGPVTAAFFSGAKLTLTPSSSLVITLAQKNSFDLKLTGDFEWADITIGPVKKVRIATKFEGMRLLYTEGAALSFDIGKWSFASPQKSLANFPVTIENVKYISKTKQGSEVLRGGVSLEIIANIGDKVGGRTKLEVIGAIERPAGKKFVPKFIEARVDSISLFVKTSAVVMSGYIKFMQEDPVFGNGFKGTIKATFATAQMEIAATAMFGSTSYQSATPYRYWYVDAKAILPPPGVVFLPGYAFYGMGVGAWQRVNVSTMPALNAAQVAGATSPSGAPASGATFTPSKNIGFGFSLTAVLGTSPDSKKFNADVTLSGQFTPSGGLVNIHIKGDLYAMAKITERATAPVKGVIDIDYNHPQRIFHMQAKVYIEKDPISTPGGANMVMHLEGKTGIWYVKIGEPSNRNIIKVYGVSTESYFMFGKNITAPTGFSQAITNGLHSVGVYNLSPNANATNDAIAGNGFAAGVGVNYDTGNRDKHLFGRVKLRYRIAGGFEINLSLLRYPDNATCAGGAALTGVNKWYAQGGVAAYVIVNVTIHVDPKGAPCLYCCQGNHPNGCDFTLANVTLGAYLLGGFPKPTWLQGQAGGSFNLLNGAVKGSFNVNIDYGSQCTPAAGPETGPVVQAQDAAQEQNAMLIQSIYPANNTSGFSVGDRARVLYGFTPNETFDVIEQQGSASGSTVNRTFQARYTLTFRKRTGYNTYSAPITINTPTNSLGERVVLLNTGMAVVAAPKNMMDPGEGNQAPPPMNLGWNLDSATTYYAMATGTLWEYKNNSWAIAKNKKGQAVMSTAATLFSTPSPPPQPVKKEKNIIQNN